MTVMSIFLITSEIEYPPAFSGVAPWLGIEPGLRCGSLDTTTTRKHIHFFFFLSNVFLC